jgi:hypothetical protein
MTTPEPRHPAASSPSSTSGTPSGLGIAAPSGPSPDAALDPPPGTAQGAPNEEQADGSMPPAAMPAANGPWSWVAPYLVVLVLGLVAALMLLAQLWVYRDELRTIFTQTPV